MSYTVRTGLVAFLLFTGIAQAMPIPQFHELNKGPAGGLYIADLVKAAETSLINAGRTDDAVRVRDIFATNAPGSQESIGVQQFYMTLAIARTAPNGPQIKVEKVLAVSLDKNEHIKLPDNFLTTASALDSKYAVLPKK
jgi:hypothetical protein